MNTHLIAFWLDSKLDSKCSFLKTSHHGYEMQTIAICRSLNYKCILLATIAIHWDLVANMINCIYYILIKLHLVIFFYLLLNLYICNYTPNFMLTFVKPGARGRRPRAPGFLKLLWFARRYVCVCPPPRPLITSGVI